jgi:transcriptional regulator with XRE-family HTH domain
VPTPASPTVRRRRLATELRRLREHLDLTGEEVADRLGWSAAKISRIETAKTGARPTDVRKLLELYGVEEGHRDELLTLAREAERKGWWEAYSDALSQKYYAFIGLEAEAESAKHWETQVIPGLFQTEAYARETVLAVQTIATIPPGQIKSRTEARLLRQQVLTRDRPLELSVVLDESVLHRRFGDKAVMRAQLDRLVDTAQLPNVTLRVLPLNGRQLGVSSFTLLRFSPLYDMTLRDVVFIEQLTSGFYFEEELDTYRYALAFDQLATAALDETRSIERIKRISDEFWR